ncbi:MAG: hypothetical protein H6899_01480 [Rhodobacter sp.]|nr:hypothetical protein [Paracoccaceae bacterium]MCC0078632.1 hypothetical protein [Rhodobacter sp.]
MSDLPFSDLLDRLEARDTAPPGDPRAVDPRALADTQLIEGEGVLEAWLASRGLEPTAATHEGFRLLALHRQGARGEPSFNACRETCRELVYLRNVALAYDGDTPELRRTLRLQAMVLRHLALFVGGKMVEAGLGDFCCSSRPLRHRDAPPLQGD